MLLSRRLAAVGILAIGLIVVLILVLQPYISTLLYPHPRPADIVEIDVYALPGQVWHVPNDSRPGAFLGTINDRQRIDEAVTALDTLRPRTSYNAGLLGVSNGLAPTQNVRAQFRSKHGIVVQIDYDDYSGLTKIVGLPQVFGTGAHDGLGTVLGPFTNRQCCM